MKLSCAGTRSSAPEIKKSPNGRFFYFCARMRMRTGEKAVRTAAKRRTTESRSNRRKKADDSTPVVRMHNFARWRSNPVIRPAMRLGSFSMSPRGAVPPQKNNCLCGMLFNHGTGLLKKSTAPHTGCGHIHIRIGVLFCERIIHF